MTQTIEGLRGKSAEGVASTILFSDNHRSKYVGSITDTEELQRAVVALAQRRIGFLLNCRFVVEVRRASLIEN